MYRCTDPFTCFKKGNIASICLAGCRSPQHVTSLRSRLPAYKAIYSPLKVLHITPKGMRGQ